MIKNIHVVYWGHTSVSKDMLDCACKINGWSAPVDTHDSGLFWAISALKPLDVVTTTTASLCLELASKQPRFGHNVFLRSAIERIDRECARKNVSIGIDHP